MGIFVSFYKVTCIWNYAPAKIMLTAKHICTGHLAVCQAVHKVLSEKQCMQKIQIRMKTSLATFELRHSWQSKFLLGNYLWYGLYTTCCSLKAFYLFILVETIWTIPGLQSRCEWNKRHEINLVAVWKCFIYFSWNSLNNPCHVPSCHLCVFSHSTTFITCQSKRCAYTCSPRCASAWRWTTCSWPPRTRSWISLPRTTQRSASPARSLTSLPSGWALPCWVSAFASSLVHFITDTSSQILRCDTQLCHSWNMRHTKKKIPWDNLMASPPTKSSHNSINILLVAL